MNREFRHGLSEFLTLQTQLQFEATYEDVARAFSDEFVSWPVPGLGEAQGFVFKFAESGEPFAIKTFVNDARNRKTELEWLVDAKNLTVAESILGILKISPELIRWKKSGNPTQPG